MAKITEIWFILLSISPFSNGNKRADTCRGCVGTCHSEVLIQMFFQWDSPFHKGLAWQRGATDAACIITAVLISVSDTSTAICRYFQQKKNRNGSYRPALSDLFRIMADVFFFQRFFRCWHGKGRKDRRIVQVFNHLWISMTIIWLYLTNCRAVSLYKLRKFFGKCKWGLDSSGRQSKRRRVSLPASTTKSTSSNETKTFMTSNYIAKLSISLRLTKSITLNTTVLCDEKKNSFGGRVINRPKTIYCLDHQSVISSGVFLRMP